MGRPPRIVCRECGQPPPEGEELSARGKCRPCGVSAQVQNLIELRGKSGPRYRTWRDRLTAAMLDLSERDRVS